MTRCPALRTFETVVDAGPRRPAIVLRDRVVTFAELDGRANGVARLVSELPGGRGDPVALSISDPVLMVAAQLGVLKAGRPYAVINPHFPASRRRAMRQLLRASTVLCDPGPAAAEAVPVPEESVATRPTCDAGPDDLAYVLFTSGSTGVPKGIAQTRGDMAQNVLRHAPLRISPADRISLITADGVISAVSNLFIGVFNGAAVAPYSFRPDGIEPMANWLAECGVTAFYAFPSFLRQLAKVMPAASAPTVRVAYIGGEPVYSSDFSALGRMFPAATRATGLNSTETGLTRLFQLPAGMPVPARIPLGLPVDGVDVTVDSDARIVIRSPFVKPRLWLEDGLIDLTAPGPGGTPELITGDRGEFGADGMLMHLGRDDAMVKIRGFRVEPSEVEDAIAKVEGITEAGVLAYPGDGGELELAAVVTTHRAGLDPAAIRQRAGELLPQPMVPTTVLIRDSLPRTTNGKLDRRALAAIVTAARQAASPRPADDAGPPRGTYERLRAIWQAVLRTEQIAADDDFFTLGGTSISALSVISRVRKEFGVPVRLAVMFETPTLAALVEAVDDLKDAGR